MNRYDNLLNCLLDRKRRYVPYGRTVRNWIGDRDFKYSSLSLEDVSRNFKKSDTIFVLGGSESISDITEDEWAQISKHDSFAMNWWPLHKFVPTYYYTNYPNEPFAFKKFVELLSPRIKKDYGGTVFFISGNRAVQRGLHPRTVPALFPANARCCLYKLPEPLQKDAGEQFSPADFATGNLYYRGGLTVVLHLINQLGGYKNIVLLGVDLKNRLHFYDSWPEMQWQFTSGYKPDVQSLAIGGSKSETNEAKYPLSEYIHSLNRLFYAPNGVQLYVGSMNSVLSGSIPTYKWGAGAP